MTKLSNTLNNVEEELKSAKSIKEENSTLTTELKNWKNKFLKIINFIKNRLLRPKDKERYNEFTADLYEHGAIDRGTFVDIKDNYSKDKRKDDFER